MILLRCENKALTHFPKIKIMTLNTKERLIKEHDGIVLKQTQFYLC